MDTDLRPARATPHRPESLIRSPEDRDDHARKGQWLGLSAEEHARFTYLILRGEAAPEDFRGLVGDTLKARVNEIWAAGRTNA